MIFETHTLTSPLDKYIEAIFYFKDFMLEHSIERGGYNLKKSRRKFNP